MRIIFTDSITGNLCEVAPISKEGMEKDLSRPLTEQEYRDRIMSTLPATATLVVVLDEPLPVEYKYPDARYQNPINPTEILYDIPKVKEYALKGIRKKRDALLVRYDGLLLRAQEIGTLEEVNDIKLKKQQLRDATEPLKALENPTSVEQIEALVPDLSNYEVD